MDTIHFKDMISNNDVIKLLEEVGFSEIKGNEAVGYLLRRDRTMQDIEVYLKGEYLNIHLTPSYLNLDFYKFGSRTYYCHEILSRTRSWYHIKQMKYKKDAGMKEFRDFLLLSICRDSFLDHEEEAYKTNTDGDWKDGHL